MRRYQIEIDESNFDVSVASDGDSYTISIDGAEHSVTLGEASDGAVHVMIDNESHQAETKSGNGQWRVVIAGIAKDARVYDYHLAAALKSAQKRAGNEIAKSLRAPMPGMTLRVDVAEGDKVERGQTVLILEAMKMENVIKAMGEGIVKRIHVAGGKSVEKGEMLVEFE